LLIGGDLLRNICEIISITSDVVGLVVINEGIRSVSWVGIAIQNAISFVDILTSRVNVKEAIVVLIFTEMIGAVVIKFIFLVASIAVIVFWWLHWRVDFAITIVE